MQARSTLYAHAAAAPPLRSINHAIGAATHTTAPPPPYITCTATASMEATPTWIGFDNDAACQRYWSHLKARERKDPAFKHDAPYAKHRRLYVDGVWQLCEDHRLAETTAHLATRYFDFALQAAERTLFSEFSLDEIRVACVLLAAKYDEHESPPPRVLRGQDNSRLDAYRLREAEARVAEVLEWRLGVVTSLVALDLAADFVVQAPDMVRGAPLQRSPKAQKFVASYARFFCNMSLQANRFQSIAPTLLCSAVIRATRELLNVSPSWPQRLVNFTGYADGDLSRLARDLLAYYRREFPDHHASVRSFAASPKSVLDIGREVRSPLGDVANLDLDRDAGFLAR